MIYFELNGAIINNSEISGIDELIITYRRKEDRRIVKSFTNKLEFSGTVYNFLKSKLIDDQYGLMNSVSVKIYDDCCLDLSGSMLCIFEGEIRGDSIDWCEGNCVIGATVYEKNAELDAWNILNSKFIWDDYQGKKFNENYTLVNLTYCKFYPVWLAILNSIIKTSLDVFDMLISSILLSIYPVLALICTIVAAFSSKIKLSDCSFKNLVGNKINQMWKYNEEFQIACLPCGNLHPVGLIRNYSRNICNLAGLQFQSSIFDINSAYYNLVYATANIRKGAAPIKGAGFAGLNSTPEERLAVWNANKPVLTGIMFFDELCQVFNADYWIIDNKLIFERRDSSLFYQTKEWIDTAKISDRIIEYVCFKWIDKKYYAGGIFTYVSDATDEIGNEAGERYNDIVSWKTKDVQTGLFEKELIYSPARTKDDGVSTAINLFPAYKKCLFIEKDTFQNPKLIIVDNPYADIVEIRSNYVNGRTASNQSYNYPMWFWANGSTGIGNLYDKFWAIENPNQLTTKRWEFQFTFRYTCDELRSFIGKNENGFTKYITLYRNGTKVKGNIYDIEVNFKSKTIKVTGEV